VENLSQTVGNTDIKSSCELDCATKGTCCSDFHHCETMIMNNRGKEAVCKSKEKRLGKCDFCDFTKDECLQCVRMENISAKESAYQCVIVQIE